MPKPLEEWLSGLAPSCAKRRNTILLLGTNI